MSGSGSQVSFRVSGFGSRVSGVGFRGEDWGCRPQLCRVKVLGLEPHPPVLDPGARGFLSPRVGGLGCRVWGLGSGFRVKGAGRKV